MNSLTSAATEPASNDEWVSVPNAVRRTGLARQTLLSMGLRGVLLIRPIGGRLLVCAESLRKWEVRRNNSSQHELEPQ